MALARDIGAICFATALLAGSAQAAVISGYAAYGVEVLSISGPDAENDLDFFLDTGPGEYAVGEGQITAFAEAETTGFDFPASPFVASAEIAISATPTSVPSYVEALANNGIFLIIFNLSETNSYDLSLKFSYEFGITGSPPFAPFGTSIAYGNLRENEPCGVNIFESFGTADAPFSDSAAGECALDITLGPATPTESSLYSVQVYMDVYGESFEAAVPLPAGASMLMGALAGLAGLRLRRRAGTRS